MVCQLHVNYALESNSFIDFEGYSINALNGNIRELRKNEGTEEITVICI